MNPPRHSRRLALVRLATAVLALSGAAARTWGETIKGNGVIKKENRAPGSFNGIALGIPAQLEVRMGNVEDVTVETDENVLPWVETVVENGTLHIRPARRDLNLQVHTLNVVVQARQLARLSIVGGGSIRSASLKSPQLELDIGGAGTIDLGGLESNSVACAVGGSGNLRLAGTAGTLIVSIGGSGDVKAGQLKADNVEVSISGSGDVTVWVARKLQATIAGAGNINYYGDPQVRTTVVGSGAARRLGPAPP